MRRVFVLSTREQLLVLEELGAYLGAPAAEPETDVAKLVAARQASLAQRIGGITQAVGIITTLASAYD